VGLDVNKDKEELGEDKEQKQRKINF